MDKRLEAMIKPLPQQITYSNILFWGAWGGIALMTITYFIYLAHLLPPQVDVNMVIANWDKGVQEYIEITNSPHGWGWLFLLHKGDFINFLGIAFLALLTIVCYLVLFVGYIKKNDKIYATIAILEVLVLALAASGLLGSGGH